MGGKKEKKYVKLNKVEFNWKLKVYIMLIKLRHFLYFRGGGAFVHLLFTRTRGGGGGVKCPGLSTRRGGGVKIGQNLVQVVVECPIR